jgi:hypothetical protein
MKVTTLACLFVSKDGRLAIRLMEPPLPSECFVPSIPPEMARAARDLGAAPEIRAFKRAAVGTLPVYEEI